MQFRIKNLIELLNHYTKLYEEGNSKISDSEWDDLYLRLKELEEQTGIIYPNSPTQKIIYTLKTELKKVMHNSPMLSLDKIKNNIQEAENFIGENIVVISGKMDGLTCRLTYRDGSLVRAETRGDGYIGEDITHNARVVKSIPQQISYKEDLVVDGEIICTKANFEPFKNDYKNTRAFASGSIRLLDNKECEKRNLTFVAWNVVEGFEENNYYNYDLQSLDSYGFTVVPYTTNNNKHLIERDMDFIVEHCKSNEYPIDGCVFKLDSKKKYAEAGSTDHHPRGAIAYKFEDESYTTFLKYIDWTMGRTGVLTPTAVFDAIEIDGTTVERASLHNVTIMEELLTDKPYRHQKIEVYKANMIIPQIKKSHWEENEKKEYLSIPTVCPICGESVQLMTLNESTDLICMNPQCEGKLVNKLDHFAGKKGLDIKGLSKATLERLINWGWVKSATDLFQLKAHKEEWIDKDGFGEKSVSNILEAIKKSEVCSLDKFIAALGIPLIGSVASKQLAKEFSTWENFYLAVQSEFNFYDLPNFGPEMHDAILRFDYTEADSIARNFLLIQKTVVSSVEQKFANMTFCVTGKLKNFKNRTEIKNYIEEHGGKVTDSVSSKTNYLINNDKNSTSSKNKKAQELNIPIISEEELNII